MNKETNETNKIVIQIAKILAQHKPINLFKLAINPKSFSQSVENLFYLSFLIHNNRAKYYFDGDEPMIG